MWWQQDFFNSFLVIIYLFIYLFILFMAVLGLRFCARAFSSCGEQGPLFIAVRGPLTITASLVVEHRLQTRKLSNCGSRAQPLCGMWDLPRPGLEPASPALAGRFSTTVPPGKPDNRILKQLFGRNRDWAKITAYAVYQLMMSLLRCISSSCMSAATSPSSSSPPWFFTSMMPISW